MAGVYFAGSLIRLLFSLEVYPLNYVGTVWTLRIITLCVLCFLETGMSMVYPAKTRRWVIGALVLFAVFVLLTIINFPYGSEIPENLDTPSMFIPTGILFLVIFVNYKIIVETLKLPLKKRGGLIILFSSGVFLNLFSEFGNLLSLMFGIYAVVYARVTAGLNFSKKKKKWRWLFFV